MRIWQRFGAALALTIISCGAAVAGDHGFYLDFFGGANLLQDSDFTVTIDGQGQIPAVLDYNLGWLAGAAAGYSLTNGLAFEAEFAFRDNALNSVSEMGGEEPMAGHIASASLMANALYRLPIHGPVTPYIGGGLGAAWLSVNALPADSPQGFQDSGVFFAYQAFAGLAVAVGQRTSMSFEYRFFGSDPTFHDTPPGSPLITIDPPYRSHALMIKLSRDLD